MARLVEALPGPHTPDALIAWSVGATVLLAVVAAVLVVRDRDGRLRLLATVLVPIAVLVPWSLRVVREPALLWLEHFGLDTLDIEKDVARLKALGATLQEGPMRMPNGVQIAFLAGPDDVRFELIQKA